MNEVVSYELDLNKLKKQQGWLVHRGRLLLKRKRKIMDLGNGIGEVDEGIIVADLIRFIDEMIMLSESLDRESVTIALKKSS
tara:strand:- start:44 stop:289 length:246 start_codon:yes stop_codon:yes gene_type:complete